MYRWDARQGHDVAGAGDAQLVGAGADALHDARYARRRADLACASDFESV